MQKLTLLLSLALLAACSAARDERLTTEGANRTPVAHTTIVDCPVYDGMTKSSAVLASTTTGSEVQVTDTISAYFVRVRVDKNGQTISGYMDRRCCGVPACKYTPGENPRGQQGEQNTYNQKKPRPSGRRGPRPLFHA